MSCQSRISLRIIAPALLLGTLLAGCSDIYFDRREGIVPAAGDAVAVNRAAQMVDPWSPASANNWRAVHRGPVLPPRLNSALRCCCIH